MLEYAYPLAYGVEEEASLRWGELRNQSAGRESAIGTKALCVGVADFRNASGPERLYAISRAGHHGQYDTAGARLYVDGEHAEFVTAECSTIEDVIARTQAHEELEVGVAGRILMLSSLHKVILINRRTVDACGNSFACHDNIGMVAPRGIDHFDFRTRPTLVAHLATRSFVSGAGHVAYDPEVDAAELRFAQKVSTLVREKGGRAHRSFMYDTKISSDEGQEVVVEVRCSDANISLWAAAQRIAGAAIALSVGLSGLGNRLAQSVQPYLSHPLDEARQANRLVLGDDGRLLATAALRRSIDYQRQEAIIFLSRAMRWRCGKQPAELAQLAAERIEFCNDMDKVLAGKQPFTILDDRADWAAKFGVTARRIARDRTAGKERYWGDLQCRIDDQAYDLIRVHREVDPRQGKSITVANKVGYGYKLRDKMHQFRREIPPEVVRQKALTPPQQTRAALRAQLIRDYMLAAARWDCVTLLTPSGRQVSIDFPSVKTTSLNPKQTEQLGRLQSQRRA